MTDASHLEISPTSTMKRCETLHVVTLISDTHLLLNLEKTRSVLFRCSQMFAEDESWISEIQYKTSTPESHQSQSSTHTPESNQSQSSTQTDTIGQISDENRLSNRP